MLVFRVAHTVSKRKGTDYFSGPYSRWVEPELPDGTSEKLIVPMGQQHSRGTDHYSPNSCPIIGGINFSEVCGLVSRQAVNTWFHGWLGLLKRYGYRVYVFDVPDEFVRVGMNGQCVFQISHASLVRTEEITA